MAWLPEGTCARSLRVEDVERDSRFGSFSLSPPEHLNTSEGGYVVYSRAIRHLLALRPLSQKKETQCLMSYYIWRYVYDSLKRRYSELFLLFWGQHSGVCVFAFSPGTHGRAELWDGWTLMASLPWWPLLRFSMTLSFIAFWAVMARSHFDRRIEDVVSLVPHGSRAVPWNITRSFLHDFVLVDLSSGVYLQSWCDPLIWKTYL